MGGERIDLARITEAANSVVIDLRRAWGASGAGSVTETALAVAIEGWDAFLYELRDQPAPAPDPVGALAETRTADTCQHPDMYACGRDGGKHGHCADCDQRINPATPNQQRARDVIATWLASEDLQPVRAAHHRAAEDLLARIEDAGLAIWSAADDSAHPELT